MLLLQLLLPVLHVAGCTLLVAACWFAAVNVPVRHSTMRVCVFVCATCNTFKQLYQARISAQTEWLTGWLTDYLADWLNDWLNDWRGLDWNATNASTSRVGGSWANGKRPGKKASSSQVGAYVLISVKCCRFELRAQGTANVSDNTKR